MQGGVDQEILDLGIPDANAYNKIFEKLVESSSDIQGLVTYGLYKNAKKEWVSDFRSRRGRPPEPVELEEYTKMWTTTQFENAKIRAEQALAQYALVAIDNAKPQIIEDTLRGTFWSGVWKNIFSNALYTIILIGFAFILKFSGVDLVSIFETAKTPPQATQSQTPTPPPIRPQ